MLCIDSWNDVGNRGIAPASKVPHRRTPPRDVYDRGKGGKEAEIDFGGKGKGEGADDGATPENEEARVKTPAGY